MSEPSLRITVHDFVGHAFQTRLSAELARRGHTVQHIFFPGFLSPNERPAKAPQDPDSFFLDPAGPHGAYPKYSYLRRAWMDRRYLRACISRIAAFQPDVVVSANAAPYIQAGLLKFCRRHAIAFVNWVQDCYGVAAEKILVLRIITFEYHCLRVTLMHK